MFDMLEDQGDKRAAVAARLSAARQALGLTKREFAEAAGMSEQNYGPYENGRRDLSLPSAKKIRKAHGLTLEFIYFGNKADLPHRIAKLL